MARRHRQRRHRRQGRRSTSTPSSTINRLLAVAQHPNSWPVPHFISSHQPAWLPNWGVYGIGAATLYWLFCGASALSSYVMGPSVSEAVFRAAIPSSLSSAFRAKYNQDLGDVILAISSATGVSPVLVFAIGYVETRLGTASDYTAADETGDGGHGRGIWQVDDRTWGSWLAANNWKDPITNGTFAMQNVLLGQAPAVQGYLTKAGASVSDPAFQNAVVAAYNDGPHGAASAVISGQSPDPAYTSQVNAAASSLGFPLAAA